MKKISTGMLALGALAAYFLFFKAKPAPAPSAQPQPGGPPTLAQCLKSGDPTTCAKYGAAALPGLLDTVATELKGMDGMTPSSLEGVVASVGGFNGLHGTFYGSY